MLRIDGGKMTIYFKKQNFLILIPTNNFPKYKLKPFPKLNQRSYIYFITGETQIYNILNRGSLYMLVTV